MQHDTPNQKTLLYRIRFAYPYSEQRMLLPRETIRLTMQNHTFHKPKGMLTQNVGTQVLLRIYTSAITSVLSAVQISVICTTRCCTSAPHRRPRCNITIQAKPSSLTATENIFRKKSKKCLVE